MEDFITDYMKIIFYFLPMIIMITKANKIIKQIKRNNEILISITGILVESRKFEAYVPYNDDDDEE